MTGRSLGPFRGPAAPRTATRLMLVLSHLGEFWFSDGSLSDKSKCADPGLMPLPDAGTGLDWSHLVDAARAFEGKDAASRRGPSGAGRARAMTRDGRLLGRPRPCGTWVQDPASSPATCSSSAFVPETRGERLGRRPYPSSRRMRGHGRGALQTPSCPAGSPPIWAQRPLSL